MLMIQVACQDTTCDTPPCPTDDDTTCESPPCPPDDGTTCDTPPCPPNDGTTCDTPPCPGDPDYDDVDLDDINNHKDLWPLAPIEYFATGLLVIIVSLTN